jgi:hypothetical protein
MLYMQKHVLLTCLEFPHHHLKNLSPFVTFFYFPYKQKKQHILQGFSMHTFNKVRILIHVHYASPSVINKKNKEHT